MKFEKPTGICKGCGKPTTKGTHDDCYLLVDTSLNHSPKMTDAQNKKRKKIYKSGKLPKFMYT